jgi:hypothetical protein
VGGSRPPGLLRPVRERSSAANRAEADLRSLAERGVRLLHLYSEGDEGLDYLHVFLGSMVQRLQSSHVLALEVVPGVDHTFTMLWSQKELLSIIGKWVEQIVQDGP